PARVGPWCVFLICRWPAEASRRSTRFPRTRRHRKIRLVAATNWRNEMASAAPESQKPTLFVCHGDDGGPKLHPCRRVQEALRASGIEYEKVIGGHGSPFPWGRRGPRDELREATGDTKLPTLKLADGTVIKNSRPILAWIKQ